jgi:protein-tyrosine-phosphatase
MRILFVCVENSNRSQMAEGFARHYGADAASAGSRPSGRVNPIAIQAMAEKGIDISMKESKSLDAISHEEWDWVVTMGCGDSCPFVPAKNRDDWTLPDPRDLPYEEFQKVRDEIERRVRQLLDLE